MKPSERIKELSKEQTGKKYARVEDWICAILAYLDEQHEESQELSAELFEELKAREQLVATGTITDTSVGAPELETVVPVEGISPGINRKDALKRKWNVQKEEQPLKTFKDISVAHVPLSEEEARETSKLLSLFYQRARTEAIRWVKLFEEPKTHYIQGFNEGEEILYGNVQQMARWIMHHYNITEDELR